MGIKSEPIIKNVSVDNKTIDTNPKGEIEIKGGAVTRDLLSSELKNSGYYLVKYILGNTGLDIDTTTNNFGDQAVHTVWTKKMSISLNQIRIGFEIWTSSVGTYQTITGYLYKNGSLIGSNATAATSPSFYSYDVSNINKGDTFEIKIKGYVNSGGTKIHIRNKGIYGNVTFNF